MAAQRRAHARRIFEAATRAADPGAGVRAAVLAADVQAALALPATRRVLLVGAGKASAQMAAAALDGVRAAAEDKEVAGHVITKHGHAPEALRAELARHGVAVSEGGHPLPDAAGVEATRAVLALAKESASTDTVVLNFVSGGGSSLTALPVRGLSLEDLQGTVGLLLGCGASIEELNTVRRHLTAFQGGRLAAALSPAQVFSFVLSDVVGDPVHVIAGGPTAGDPTTCADCLEVLRSPDFAIKESVPSAVWDALEETVKPGDARLASVSNRIIASNAAALAAAATEARALGYDCRVLTSRMQGEARHVGKALAAIARDALSPSGLGAGTSGPVCVLAGGETTVSLCADHGLGGRNQELALSAAIDLAGVDGALVLSAGTDGQDGPCDAAGALATGELCASRADLSRAKQHLARNDSYSFFQASPSGREHHLRTGPTGTNVMDVMVALAWPAWP